ncbi:MAG: VWA domain-containing protein [Burkholderiaceae bacterium]
MQDAAYPSLAAAWAAANAPFHYLASLQRELWLPALVCSSGSTAQRLQDLRAWEAALQAGQLPSAQCDLGDPAASAPLRRAVADMGLCDLAQGSAAMTRQVLRAMLWHLDRLIDRPVGEPREAAIARMVQEFRSEWTLEREGWDEVLALFKTLGELPNQRWDELRGHLNSREWNEARRIGELLAHLKEITRFIEQIGRAERSHDLPPSPKWQPSANLPRQRVAVQITTHLTDQAGEVRGVKRSGELARMLASEAAMIRHPLLHRLWRARFAEAQLLTYESEAVLTQWRLQPDDSRLFAATKQTEPLGKGPMIVCLDTSGSMRGAPENVAKACVLQALRTAHAAQRACKLLAFGGAGELLERDLALTTDGLQVLLDTMGQSFDGGTDAQTPLERANELVRTQAFALADILIVSDGEFGVTPATLATLRECKTSLGLRVHSILIGDRETIGLLEVSDQIHWVRDWRRYATQSADAFADGYSPVHSRSLTAEYFPNAINRASSATPMGSNAFLTPSGHLVMPARPEPSVDHENNR